MKIKADFVTNSSSSSFVVMGAHIPNFLISEELLPAIRKKCDLPELTMEEIKQYPLEYIEGLFDKDFDFSSGHPDDEETPMAGIPYESMRDDETKREFKARVKKGIKDALNVDVKVYHIEECWEDR